MAVQHLKQLLTFKSASNGHESMDGQPIKETLLDFVPP